MSSAAFESQKHYYTEAFLTPFRYLFKPPIKQEFPIGASPEGQDCSTGTFGNPKTGPSRAGCSLGEIMYLKQRVEIMLTKIQKAELSQREMAQPFTSLRKNIGKTGNTESSNTPPSGDLFVMALCG
jgi:hypothetical protein